MIRKITCLTILVFLSYQAGANETGKKTKYREGKKIDFESLLIEGQKKKADYSVVTGNLGEQDFGLLKLREDFTDVMADEFSQEIE